MFVRQAYKMEVCVEEENETLMMMMKELKR